MHIEAVCYMNELQALDWNTLTKHSAKHTFSKSVQTFISIHFHSFSFIFITCIKAPTRYSNAVTKAITWNSMPGECRERLELKCAQILASHQPTRTHGPQMGCTNTWQQLRLTNRPEHIARKWLVLSEWTSAVPRKSCPFSADPRRAHIDALRSLH